MIPAEKMIALWDSDDDMRITKLVVVHIDKQTPATDRLPASSGASDQGWMQGDILDTPFGLFAHLAVAYGFKSRKDAIAVLREFGKVEGQDWVKGLLQRAGVED